MMMTKNFPLVDSHCHLNCIDLTEFHNDLNEVIEKARDNGVEHMLSVAVEPDDIPVLVQLAETYNDVSISVGIHPNTEMPEEWLAPKLIALAKHPACIAIGETGLDYYRVDSAEGQTVQKERFREHIKAAIASSKPLIIHTRQAAEDTIIVMKEAQAEQIGGVMHCFSESWDIAREALDLNFYISFSGILTFKNAVTMKEVAKKVPLDRILIETDSPYLAPVPFRGKQNHPALVKHVVVALSEILQMDYEHVAAATTENFYRCFNLEKGARGKTP